MSSHTLSDEPKKRLGTSSHQSINFDFLDMCMPTRRTQFALFLFTNTMVKIPDLLRWKKFVQGKLPLSSFSRPPSWEESSTPEPQIIRSGRKPRRCTTRLTIPPSTPTLAPLPCPKQLPPPLHLSPTRDTNSVKATNVLIRSTRHRDSDGRRGTRGVIINNQIRQQQPIKSTMVTRYPGAPRPSPPLPEPAKEETPTRGPIIRTMRTRAQTTTITKPVKKAGPALPRLQPSHSYQGLSTQEVRQTYLKQFDLRLHMTMDPHGIPDSYYRLMERQPDTAWDLHGLLRSVRCRYEKVTSDSNVDICRLIFIHLDRKFTTIYRSAVTEAFLQCAFLSAEGDAYNYWLAKQKKSGIVVFFQAHCDFFNDLISSYKIDKYPGLYAALYLTLFLRDAPRIWRQCQLLNHTFSDAHRLFEQHRTFLISFPPAQDDFIAGLAEALAFFSL